jgi:hypothetical protein
MKRGHSNRDEQQCIEQCMHCHRVCLQTAMNHCLEEGSRHVEPGHFRLMIACSDICRVAGDFMLMSSELHPKVCAVCADACDACAQSCEEIGGMEECVRACRQCAESCRQMAGAGPGTERAARRGRAVAAPM